MQLLTKSYVLANKNKILKELIGGKTFVYPTDTVYALGCNALVADNVKKIRELKKKPNDSLSVIAPNLDWIFENYELNQSAKNWVAKLPGPYTLKLNLKTECLPKEVVDNSKSMGIRIPNNWFSDLIRETKLPFIITSANVSGSLPMTDFYDLDSNIREKVDYIVIDGSIKNRTHLNIDLTSEKEKITEN